MEYKVLRVLIGLLSAISGQVVAEPVTRSYGGSYAELRSSLEQAIIGEGLVINSVAHVGDMLERTGQDLGQTAPVYRHAEVFEFCSATLSRDMMQANPQHIVFCPFTIAVFELPAGGVHLAYNPPAADPDTPALAAVRKLLARIAEAATF